MKNLLVLALFCLCACGVRPADAQSGIDEFAKEMRGRVEAADRSLRVEQAGPLHLVISTPSGKSQEMYLDNVHRLSQQRHGDEREALLDHYVRATIESLAPPVLAPEQVMPVVKHAAWIESAKRMFADKDQAWEGLFDPLGADLFLVYAQDTETGIRFLTKGDLKALGMQQPEVRALAIRNLARLVPEIEVHRGEQVAMVAAGGNYEASLLLLDDFWRIESGRSHADLVFAVPARDLLLFADAADPAALMRLAELAQRVAGESAYAVSEALYVRTAAGVERYRPR